MSYRGGIFTAQCTKNANHGMLLVGFGYDPNVKTNFWLLRNFWTSNWGVKGHIKIQVNDGNNKSCFVTNRAYLPLVTK